MFNWNSELGFINDYDIPSWQLDYCHFKHRSLNFLALYAYIYGYPLVITETTKKIMLANGVQINKFFNERFFPNSQYSTIVRPNVDTLYSMAWLNLSKEPIVLSVPDTHNKYYLMELLDSWTNVYASIGARTTGTAAGSYAITGPQWNGLLPEGLIRIEAPNNNTWVIGRTQTNGPKDYPVVHAIQDNYTLIPLSCWRKYESQYKDAYAKKQLNVTPANQVADMNAAAFFQTMMRAMYMNPPRIEDPAAINKLTVLGLIPSKAFDFYNLSSSVKQALELAVDYGPKLIQAEAAKKYTKNNINGWTLLIKGMGFYGADYMLRAVIAMTGIGANLPQDSVYFSAFVDIDGIPLVGYNNYIIHFNKKQFPPVNAFWSITIYNNAGYLVENPINRYAISPHLDKLKYNTDGSLDIFIGNTSLGKDDNTNWLPVSEEAFNLILRMYWPKPVALNRQWNPTAIIRI
jgi:hypothetical protein